MLPVSVPGSAFDEVAFAAGLAKDTDPAPCAGVHAWTLVCAVTTTVRDSPAAKSLGENTQDSAVPPVTLQPAGVFNGVTAQLPPTAGSVSLSTTLCAVPGPWLVTVIEKVAVPPALIVPFTSAGRSGVLTTLSVG